MMLRQLLTQQVRHEDAELDLLGRQIALVIESFRHPDEEHECAVRHERFPGRELLPGDATRRFLVFDSLPGSINVKAIGIDKRTLFVELSAYDPEKLAETELPKGVRLDIVGRALRHGRRKLAFLSCASKDVAREHGNRWLWMVSWDTLPEDELRLAIRTLDLLDQSDVYEAPRASPASTPASMSGTLKPGMGLEMRLGLHLDLIQEQVPILAVRAKNTGPGGMRLEQTAVLAQEARLEQQLEFKQLQRFELWLKRNPVEAIREALERDGSPEGQARLVKFIEFKMARDVREAARASGQDIAWSQARRIVRKMMRS